MRDVYTYPAVFDYAEDGINVWFPDLGCVTCADTEEEALFCAEDVMGLHLYYEEEESNEIPDPTPVDQIQLKQGEKVFLITVEMPDVRKEIEINAQLRSKKIREWAAKYLGVHSLSDKEMELLPIFLTDDRNISWEVGIDIENEVESWFPVQELIAKHLGFSSASDFRNETEFGLYWNVTQLPDGRWIAWSDEYEVKFFDAKEDAYTFYKHNNLEV